MFILLRTRLTCSINLSFLFQVENDAVVALTLRKGVFLSFFFISILFMLFNNILAGHCLG